MSRILALVTAVLISAAPAASSADETATRPPVDAFGSLPLVSQPQLSPDGKHIAMVQPLNGRPAAVIYTVGAPKGGQLNGVSNSTGLIEGVEWANNDRLLVISNTNKKSSGKTEAWYRTFSVDVTGNSPVMMFANSAMAMLNYSTAEVSDLDLDDVDHVYMPLLIPTASGARNDVYRVSVTTGKAELVQTGSVYTYEWIMDGHGNIVARVDQTHSPLTDHLNVIDGTGQWKEVAQYDATGGHSANIAGLTEDGHAFAHFANNKITGTDIITRFDPATTDHAVLFSDPKYDVQDTLTDPWTGRVIGASYIDDKIEYRYFDEAMQNLQLGLEAAFPGLSVHAVSWDTAKDRIIIEVDAPRKPLAYYYLDRTTHQATKIAPAYPDLHEADLGEMRPYAYKARDGLDIPGYLTLPPGKAAKNLPTVIYPHGGPSSRDELGFNWLPAFLANRGYAVLQPNFRGSTGYGEKFATAGYGQWGLKMQDDVTDGVRKLIADGIADPKRICIVGWSYGGYAALEGAASTPDLYACAASFAGVTDLRKFLKTRATDYGWKSWMISTWTTYIGDRSDDADKLDAASPALHADLIRCPVLLMHGAGDTTVRIDQSEVMRDALLRKGRDVRFVPFDTDNHYMQLADTRIRVLQELEAFLAKNIGN